MKGEELVFNGGEIKRFLYSKIIKKIVKQKKARRKGKE